MTTKVHIHPHNDLLNLAHYHLSVIDEKLMIGEEDAIALDAMSCLIALAFSIEALINFVGATAVRGWADRQSFKTKVERVCDTVGIEFERTKEPYSTVWELKEIRDQIAHGKPIYAEVLAISADELKKAMMAPWERFLTPSYTKHAFEQVSAFERELLDRSGTPIEDSLTFAVPVSKRC